MDLAGGRDAGQAPGRRNSPSIGSNELETGGMALDWQRRVCCRFGPDDSIGTLAFLGATACIVESHPGHDWEKAVFDHERA